FFAGIRDGDRCDFRRDEAPGRGAQRRQFYRANAGHAGTVARLREGQAAIVREDTRIVDAGVWHASASGEGSERPHSVFAGGEREGRRAMKIARVIRFIPYFIVFCVLPSSSRAQVTSERLLHSSKEPQNWLMYSGDYAGHRFSA